MKDNNFECFLQKGERFSEGDAETARGGWATAELPGVDDNLGGMAMTRVDARSTGVMNKAATAAKLRPKSSVSSGGPGFGETDAIDGKTSRQCEIAFVGAGATSESVMSHNARWQTHKWSGLELMSYLRGEINGSGRRCNVQTMLDKSVATNSQNVLRSFRINVILADRDNGGYHRCRFARGCRTNDLAK